MHPTCCPVLSEALSEQPWPVSSSAPFPLCICFSLLSDLLSSVESLRTPDLSLRDRTDGPAAYGGGLCHSVLPVWFLWITAI
ncbi:hypothetical protein LEMLEM_LOCUS10457, partial [Lemmus lemmus]